MPEFSILENYCFNLNHHPLSISDPQYSILCVDSIFLSKFCKLVCKRFFHVRRQMIIILKWTVQPQKTFCRPWFPPSPKSTDKTDNLGGNLCASKYQGNDVNDQMEWGKENEKGYEEQWRGEVGRWNKSRMREWKNKNNQERQVEICAHDIVYIESLYWIQLCCQKIWHMRVGSGDGYTEENPKATEFLFGRPKHQLCYLFRVSHYFYRSLEVAFL